MKLVTRERSTVGVQEGPRTRQPAGRSPAACPAPRAVVPLPIEEIYGLYPGEWVVVKVTTLDERQTISHGVVLAHSRSRKRISAALLRTHQKDPTVHTYLFFGGSEPATDEEWRERLAQASAKIKDYKDYLYGGR